MSDQHDCQQLVQDYISYLNDGFEVFVEDGVCHIITPYWLPDGDHIEFFVTNQTKTSVTLTDEGQMLDWLFASGVEVENNENRQQIVELIAKQYDLTLKNGDISLQVSTDNLAVGVHRYLTALKQISQLVLFRKQRGKPTFKDEVALFLTNENQKYSTDFKIRGKTLEHRIDFFLNSERNWLIETLTATTPTGGQQGVVKTSFTWVDIREGGWDYRKITLIDDSGEKWEDIWSKPKILNPLLNYSDEVIRWSDRIKLLAPLV